MLEDTAGIRRVVIAYETVDLRKGLDSLAMIIGDKYKQDPFESKRQIRRPTSAIKPLTFTIPLIASKLSIYGISFNFSSISLE